MYPSYSAYSLIKAGQAVGNLPRTTLMILVRLAAVLVDGA